MLYATDHVRRTSRAAWQELEGETVLLLSQEERLLGLNAVGGRIWQLADGSRSVGEISAAIGLEFAGAERSIVDDALRFLERLLERGLVERCGA